MSHYKHPHLTHPQYRRDIDGLRAIAILAVIVFHAFPGNMPGGFIGVDVFFVISGFLISTIIFSSLERDRFSLAEFYVRRINRIFPALILVLASCLLLGWFILLADEYKQLGKHTGAGAGFLQNIMLWRESGYFDNSAETKPLLHLWSLAIEEQFYIFWPLLLASVWKRHWSFLRITAGIAAVSFAVSIYLVLAGRLSAAFYSPFSRFWELMVGGVLAYIVSHRPQLVEKHKNAQSLLGFVLIFAGLLLIDKRRDFPGWWALLPTLGAFFLISAGPGSWLNEKLLSNKLMVWIGLISYPLYLWHWVLLTYARIAESGQPSKEIRLAALALALILAWLTYLLIERPIRQGRHSRSKVVALAVLMVAVGCFGIIVSKLDGLKERAVARLNVSLQSGSDGGDAGFSKKECGIDNEDIRKRIAICVSDRRGVARYALLGDSKAASLYPGLMRTSTDKGRWLFIGGNGPGGAPIPLLSAEPMYARFQDLTTNAVRTIEHNKEIEIVVLVAAVRAMFGLSDGVVGGNISTYDYSYMSMLRQSSKYKAVFDGLDKTISIFVRAGKKVVIVVDNPALPNPQDCISRQIAIPFVNAEARSINEACFVPLSRHDDMIRKYRELLLELQHKYPNSVEIFDMTRFLCDEATGVCGPFHNGRLQYSITDHISDYSAGRVGTALNQFLDSMGKQ